MNRYVVDQFFVLSPFSETNVRVDDKHGATFVLENMVMHTYEYGCDRVVGLYEAWGRSLELVTSDYGSLSISSISKIQELIRCRDSSSREVIDIDPIDVAALLHRNNDRDMVTFLTLEGEGNWRDMELVVYDWHSRKTKSVQLGKLYLYMIVDQDGASCYGDALSRGELIKYDADLNSIWIYKTSYKKGRRLIYERIISTDQYVIFSEDSGRSIEEGLPRPYVSDDGEVRFRGGQSRPILLDGRMICLDQKTGSIVWARDFEYQIDSRKLLDSRRLAVLTANWIYILDVEDGSIIHVIETGLERLTRSGFLFVDDWFLYHFSKDFNSILIYNKADLSMVRTYEGEKGHTPFIEEPQVINGLVAVRLLNGLASGELLVIDPNDIHAPMKVEQLNGLSISIPEQELGPIVLDVEDEDLCKVLRHVEHHSVELADFHGQEGRGLDYNKCFNGEIVLRYKTSNRGDLVYKYLDRLTERVGIKIQNWGICSGSTEKKLCSLRYELVD